VTVTYGIGVIHVDREPWLDGLRQAVAAELMEIGMHRSVVVDVAEGVAPAGSAPAIAVALVGPAAAADAGMAASIDAAIAAGLVVIPVVDDLASFTAQVPPGLSPYNGFEWSGEDPATDLARVVLEELGIEDRDRRAFISHRRSDGLGAAEQLHDALTHNRFVPFIDRFALREGVEVQPMVADALERHAFLLILETPEAHLSDWVFDEVDYALSHTMGMLIVQWPGDPTPIPGSPGIPRLALGADDVTTDAHGFAVLVPDALDRVVRAVEAAHASGIVRRRRALVRNVEDAAAVAGRSCVALRDWTVDVTGPTSRSIVAVSPRLPGVADLHRLDTARHDLDPTAEALLVHATRQVRPADRQQLEWIVAGRDLGLVADNAVGTIW
jgi:hypothetical protein